MINKTTLRIERLSVNLITGSQIYVPGETYVTSFYGTFSAHHMVMFLEKIVCVTEKFEWDITNASARRWLRHTANPDNPFKSIFTYSSTMWKIELTVSKIQCLTPQQLQPLSQLVHSPHTSTKSWWKGLQAGWKRLFRNT